MRKLFSLFAAVLMAVSVWADESIATATFDGKNATYTTGWTTTGTGVGRADCVIIGAGENITSPAFDFSAYSSVKVEIKARRFGTLSDSKAVINAAIAGSSVGTIEASGTNAGNVAGSFTFTPTSSMTAAVLVFTCTNATSAGSTHGAGIGTITITGVLAGGDPSINVETTLNLASDATSGEISYTVSNPDGSTMQAAETTSATWVSNVTVDAANNKVTFNALANEGDARTATIRLTYGSITKDVTINQAKFVKDFATLPLSVAAGLNTAAVKATDGVSGTWDGSDYNNADHKVKFSKNSHYLVVKTDSQIGSCTFSMKGCAGAGNSPITIQESANGTDWTDVQSFTVTFAAKDEIQEIIVTNSFNAASRYVKFKSDKASGDVNFGLGQFTINKYTAPVVLAVSAAEYATYFNSATAYIMPENLEGITVEGVEGSALTLETRYEAGDVVPAGEALLLHGAAANYDLVACKTYYAEPLADNMLKGTDEAATTEGGALYYGLGNGNNGVGFYWMATDGGAFTCGAHKAYLALPEGAPARFLFNEVTALENKAEAVKANKTMVNGQLFILRDGKTFDVVGRIVK